MKLVLLFILSFVIIQVHSASKYNQDDEDKPYEFGFTIDGQQHRHEKKDANGIIQGEFGFITADGVYHVTVYATDENGNFRILSMRNVKISGPLDEPNAKLPNTSQFNKNQPQPNALSVPSTTQPPPPPPTTTTTTAKFAVTTSKFNGQFTTQATIKPACAGCGYVTHPPKSDKTDNKLPFQTPAFQNPKPGTVVIDTITNNNQQNKAPFVSNPLPEQQNVQQQHQIDYANQNTGNNYPQNQNNYQNTQNEPNNYQNPQNQQNPQNTYQNQENPQNTYQNQQTTESNYQNPANNYQNNNNYENGQNNYENPQNNYENQQNYQNNLPNNYLNHQNSPQIDSTAPQNPEQLQDPLLNPLSISNPASDIVVSNGAINVPNNPPIPIQDKFPNMVDGLPPGIKTDDITDLLYKFNYTVGFHGHYEKGYKNGAKVGGYFVNDRDGVSRVVTYVADENGYRPKVKFIRLDLNSDLVPKEGTEKTFGLKNFEFVWYPLN